MKVLLVDDQPDTRKLTEVYFQNEPDVEFVSLASGAEALTYLSENDTDVDAVLLDLAMPTLDGLTIAEEIRRNENLHPRGKPVKLAFFTARSIDPPIERVKEQCNVERIFLKPVDNIPKFVEDVKRLANND